MKRRITFFLFVTLAASLAHFLVVVALSEVVLGGGAPSFLVPVLRMLTAPTNFLLTSSFGHTLSPLPLQILCIANSLLWGLAIAGVILWRRLRYE